MSDETITIDGVLYRRATDDDPDDLVVDHGLMLVPVDPETLPPNPVAEMLRESAERNRPPVQWDDEVAERMAAKVRERLNARDNAPLEADPEPTPAPRHVGWYNPQTGHLHGERERQRVQPHWRPVYLTDDTPDPATLTADERAVEREYRRRHPDLPSDADLFEDRERAYQRDEEERRKR